MSQDEFQFDDPDLKGMVRVPDHDTSIAAAITVLPALSHLKKSILSNLEAFGPQTDEEMSDRFQHLNLAESTVRKRRGELVQAGLVEEAGFTRPNRLGSEMKVWRLKKPTNPNP